MAKIRRKPGSESAGYHYDAVPKGPSKPGRTPIKAPPKGTAARGPAGDYAGAGKDYARAVATLPAAARVPTERATAAATRSRTIRRRRRGEAAKSAVLASVDRGRRRRQSRYVADPAKALISSRPNPAAKPPTFEGKKTAGTPTRAELTSASKAGTLKTNKAGFATTPKVRRAAAGLKTAKRIVRKSQPQIAGLSPEERAVVPLARKAHRKHPDIPASLLMALTRQESGFQADAVSSADAQGLTQFIPSTAASYGVKFGTGPKEKQSQETGAAKLLSASGFSTDPKGALTAYTGGYSDAEYNDPVLQGAADYKALDRPGNPRARKRLVRAQRAAAAAGLAVSGPKGVVGPPPKKLVKRTVVAEKAMRQIEGRPYIWGGGHASFDSQGYDCSGAVSYVLNKVAPNRVTSPLTSGNMGSVLEPGPGALTVFYNSGHTFLRLINRKGEAEYWGTSVGDSGAGGLTRHAAPSAGYLAEYSVGHVPGMGKKQALELGADPATFTGGSSYAGVTLSSSGTTATIDPGAGVTKNGKPGFSKRPILVTPYQAAQRKFRKLRKAGVGVDQGKPTAATSTSSSDGSELTRLEKKYGKAAV